MLNGAKSYYECAFAWSVNKVVKPFFVKAFFISFLFADRILQILLVSKVLWAEFIKHLWAENPYYILIKVTDALRRDRAINIRN